MKLNNGISAPGIDRVTASQQRLEMSEEADEISRLPRSWWTIGVIKKERCRARQNQVISSTSRGLLRRQAIINCFNARPKTRKPVRCCQMVILAAKQALYPTPSFVCSINIQTEAFHLISKFLHLSEDCGCFLVFARSIQDRHVLPV